MYKYKLSVAKYALQSQLYCFIFVHFLASLKCRNLENIVLHVLKRFKMIEKEIKIFSWKLFLEQVKIYFSCALVYVIISKKFFFLSVT